MAIKKRKIQMKHKKGEEGIDELYPVTKQQYVVDNENNPISFVKDIIISGLTLSYIKNDGTKGQFVLNLDDYAKKSDITTAFKYKGSVDNYSDLPKSNQSIGDVYNIKNADKEHNINAGDNVAWNGTEWDNLAGTIDTSNLAKLDAWNEFNNGQTINGDLQIKTPLNGKYGITIGYNSLGSIGINKEWAGIYINIPVGSTPSYLDFEVLEELRFQVVKK